MSYFQSMGAIGATVTQTPALDSTGMPLLNVDPNKAACISLGGRWLGTFGGSYCEGPDGKTIPKDDIALLAANKGEVIEVVGKAPPLKKFPWKPVLIGAGALVVVLLLTGRKSAPSAPAPAQVTA